jgi:hypothetical protein
LSSFLRDNNARLSWDKGRKDVEEDRDVWTNLSRRLAMITGTHASREAGSRPEYPSLHGTFEGPASLRSAEGAHRAPTDVNVSAVSLTNHEMCQRAALPFIERSSLHSRRFSARRIGRGLVANGLLSASCESAGCRASATQGVRSTVVGKAASFGTKVFLLRSFGRRRPESVTMCKLNDRVT